MDSFTDEIAINHFKLMCEYKEDVFSYMVYMEWLDGSNFQYLGSLESIKEWENLKQTITLLNLNKTT